jgi:hypothetical protein
MASCIKHRISIAQQHKDEHLIKRGIAHQIIFTITGPESVLMHLRTSEEEEEKKKGTKKKGEEKKYVEEENMKD